MLRKIILSAVFYLISINIVLAFGCAGDGPPWDPCKFFEDSSTPSSQEQANIYLKQAPLMAQQIQADNITINKIDKLGLLGNYNQKEQNGTALEFLMWQAGFTKPNPNKWVAKYSFKMFYNGIYGYGFKYFLLPFNYNKGWGKCQSLKYIPSNNKIKKARNIMNSFQRLIKQLTKPYKSKSINEETAAVLYKRQKEFNESTIQAIEQFNYDAYMSYARVELSNYINKQKALDHMSLYYINKICKYDIGGKLTVHQM